MNLLPIHEHFEENKEFTGDPSCVEMINVMVDFYKRVGFVSPWIGYYAEEKGRLMGSAGFKGPPIDGTVEIAYGTNEEFQHKGFATEICRLLVGLSLKTDPVIKITARTFAQDNFSTRVLVKNNFKCIGAVQDPEDGEVWEWLYELP